jgi:hypothetical protein
MFGKEYTAEYDVSAALTVAKTKYLATDGPDKWFGKWPRFIPEYIGRYYTNLAKNLANAKFGQDEMLREGFNEIVSTGVVKFDIVDTLPVSVLY